MNTKASKRIASAFETAEQQKMCLAPTEQCDSRWLQRAAARGEVLCVQPGIFARPQSWDELSPPDRTLHIMRAMCQRDKDLVFAGPSAAVAHGLEVGGYDLNTLWGTTSRKGHLPNKDSLGRIIVSDDKIKVLEGIRVTSFLRTIYDCLRLMSFPSALAVTDSALRKKRIPAERLAQNLGFVCQKRRGMGRVQDIIALANGRSENGGESKTRAVIMMLGFETPDLQRKVNDPLSPSGEYRVDFAWDLPDGSVVYGELDGKEKYVDPEMTRGKPIGDTLLKERRREARITIGDAPVKVMRFSFAEVFDWKYFELLLETYGIPRVDEIPPVARRG